MIQAESGLYLKQKEVVRLASIRIMGHKGTDSWILAPAAACQCLEVHVMKPRISLDFLDSSPWPVSILDVFLNINQTEFLTYAAGH